MNIFKWSIIVNLILLSIFLRIWNLNEAGETWDEYAYISTGEQLVDLIKQDNFTDPSWYQIADHPPVARYFYGAASYLDKTYYSSAQQWYFNYDWAYSRLVSVIFFSLTVIFVALIGWELSPLIGVISGIIFIMLPVSLGLSQLVTLESPLIFFFTGTVYFFTQILKKIRISRILFTGIFMGLAIGTKLSNLLLLPLLPLMTVPWYIYEKKKLQKRTIVWLFICLYVIAGIIFILVWPGMWTHADYIVQKTMDTRFPSGAEPTSELFFGRISPHPLYYYFVYFFFTTPVPILFFFFCGVINLFYHKNPLGYILLIWFFFPFVQSFYPGAVNGIRYIIEIYAPLAIIAAIGFDALVNIVFKEVQIKSLLFVPVIFSLFLTLESISPYYLSYYNSLIGGPQNVYASKLMPLGWWGEGQRAAGKWLDINGFQNMEIGLAAMPRYVFYTPSEAESIVDFEDFKTPKEALEHENYDYIVVNYLYETTYGFNENLLNKQYVLVHSIYANGAPIVKIYKRK